jgi:replication protein C-like
MADGKPHDKLSSRTLSFAQHDPATAMASLFRPVARGRRPKGLEITATWGKVEIEFGVHTAVDTRDQTILLTIMALAAGGPEISAASTGTIGQQLWLDLNEPGKVTFEGRSTILETNLYTVLRESGLKLGGTAYDSVRKSLKRLSRIDLIVRDGDPGSRREFSQRFLSYYMDEKSGRITIALNTRLAEALVGHHVRVNLDERAALSSSNEAALIAHAWLSAWIRPGRTSQIKLDGLIGKVWGEGDVAPPTFRKRRERLRAALDEIRRLQGWTVIEDERSVLHISRPALIERD